MIPLVKAFTITNADGTVNRVGAVTYKAYFIVEFDGHFESVRADPRFLALMKRAGIPQ